MMSRKEHYEHGEWEGNLISRQLRKSVSTSQITKIALDDGKITCDQRQINRQFMQFYKNVYICEMASDSTIIQVSDELEMKGIEKSD